MRQRPMPSLSVKRAHRQERSRQSDLAADHPVERAAVDQLVGPLGHHAGGVDVLGRWPRLRFSLSRSSIQSSRSWTESTPTQSLMQVKWHGARLSTPGAAVEIPTRVFRHLHTPFPRESCHARRHVRGDHRAAALGQPDGAQRRRARRMDAKVAPARDPDALPVSDRHEPLGQARPPTKSLNENLAPLRRYLERQVNRPWNKVWSEISENLSAASTVQQHVRDHIGDFVAVSTFMKNGTIWAGAKRRAVPLTTSGTASTSIRAPGCCAKQALQQLEPKQRETSCRGREASRDAHARTRARSRCTSSTTWLVGGAARADPDPAVSVIAAQRGAFRPRSRRRSPTSWCAPSYVPAAA